MSYLEGLAFATATLAIAMAAMWIAVWVMI